METLELLKLDMANFTIQQMRPHIQQQVVAYEKKKFKEILESQKGISFCCCCCCNFYIIISIF
jgi:hypothetical protein